MFEVWLHLSIRTHASVPRGALEGLRRARRVTCLKCRLTGFGLTRTAVRGRSLSFESARRDHRERKFLVHFYGTGAFPVERGAQNLMSSSRRIKVRMLRWWGWWGWSKLVRCLQSHTL